MSSTIKQQIEEKNRLKVLEDEKRKREKRIKIALENSLIPERFKNCTLDNYFCENKGQENALKISKKYVNNYSKIKESGSSLFFCGSYGTGKTHLANAILNYLIINDIESGMYTTTMRMLRDIRRSYNNQLLSEQTLIDKYINTPLLVLDEIGVQMGTDSEKLLIYEIINGRYENYKSTIILSNLSFADLKNYMGERAIDRLKSKSGFMVVMDWDSWRSK